MSPDRSRIVYSKYTADDWSSAEIFLMNLSNKQEKQLTENSVADRHPDWSLNGSKIIFVSYQDSQGNPTSANIFTMNTDGSEKTALTDGKEENNDPEWSPDGTKIIFKSIRATQEYKEQIYVMNSDGSGVKRLTENYKSDHDPSWSPDSKFVVFERYEGCGPWVNLRFSLLGKWSVFKLDLNGNETRLTDTKPVLSWLPVFNKVGDKILFIKSFPVRINGILSGFKVRLTIMNTDGSDQKQLVEDNIHTPNIEYFDW